MENVSCCNCGIVFGVPDAYVNARRADKAGFFCPNGHRLSFTESEADRLRRERDRLQQQLAQRDDEIRRQKSLREITERKVSAAKGQVTKLKRRAQAGLCPCCNRTFSNMAAHMKTKHPEFDPKVVDFETARAAQK